jgi:hypothetical protein
MVISFVLAFVIFSNSNIALANQYANGGLASAHLLGVEGEIVDHDLLGQASNAEIEEIKITEDGLMARTIHGEIVLKNHEGKLTGTYTTNNSTVQFACDPDTSINSTEDFNDNCLVSDDSGNVVNFIDPFTLCFVFALAAGFGFGYMVGSGMLK